MSANLLATIMNLPASPNFSTGYRHSPGEDPAQPSNFMHNSPMQRWRWILYLWAFPTTLCGLLLATVAILTGGQARVVQGVLEVSGGATDFCLRRIVGLILRGGASAMTLGHVVLARDPDLLLITRAHERVHVRQCETWGPLFIPAYVVASAWAWATGRRAYKDNFFERQAFNQAG